MGRLLLPLLAAFLSLGLLTRAEARQPPAYMALGDSLAFGVGASDPATQGYVGLVFDTLRKSDRYRERGLELLNLAVPGTTSSDLLLPGGQLEAALGEIKERQQDASSLDDNVEIISIDIGGNDLLALGSPDSPCTADAAGEECRRRFLETLSDLEANLTKVVSGLREAAPKADIVIVGLYNPYSGTGSGLEVAADLGVRQLNGALGSVAANPDLRVKMAEVFDLFVGRGRQWIAADSLHPNDKGHAVIAEALLAAVQNRQPVIPEELLAEPAAPTTAAPLAADSAAQNAPDDSGIDPLLLLAIAIAAAFLGGAIISGAYLLARGRP